MCIYMNVFELPNFVERGKKKKNIYEIFFFRPDVQDEKSRAFYSVLRF